jgi:protocatechuate 3,4-dioxygenase beta subunit
MIIQKSSFRFCALLLFAFICITQIATVLNAQDTVTGAFEGTVSDSQTGALLKGADVEIINQETGLTVRLLTDNRGRFYQGLLLPGVYKIRVGFMGYQPREGLQRV